MKQIIWLARNAVATRFDIVYSNWRLLFLVINCLLSKSIKTARNHSQSFCSVGLPFGYLFPSLGRFSGRNLHLRTLCRGDQPTTGSSHWELQSLQTRRAERAELGGWARLGLSDWSFLMELVYKEGTFVEGRCLLLKGFWWLWLCTGKPKHCMS